MMKHINLVRRVIITAAATLCLSSTAFSFEPVKGPRSAPVPAQSQETLSDQQKHNGAVPVVGSVEISPRQPAAPPRAQASIDREEKLAAGLAAKGGDSNLQAAQALQKVELDNQMAATAPFRMLIWAVVVVAVGLGLAFLVKFFADKSLPQVPSNTKVRW